MPSEPHSRLSRELGHLLGGSMLGEAMTEWRPANKIQQRNLLEELLAQSRAVANALVALLEHEAVQGDDGGGTNLLDPWDLYGLADLLASLLEVTTLVSRRDCD